ncbi:MAG TPA: tetratricopeptide repeat protein [Candidatus Acidoferrum sp.]|nr:tetratricopeptide repeat protein [Candidatus Acidoferrum sp.]
MFRTPLRFFLGLLLFSCLGSSLLAQRPGTGGGRPAGGVIDVQVRYADGRPAPRGIHVRLESAEGGAEADLETIQGGKCQFHQATSGVFIVRIAEGNFKEVSSRVELINSPRAYVTLDLIPLKKEPIPEVSIPPAGPADVVSVKDLAIPEAARQEFSKGEDAMRAKNADESVKHFQKAIKLYDDYPQAYRMLGDALVEKQQWPEAETALKKSISLQPDLAPAYFDLGALRNQTKNYSGAEEALKKGLELTPDATVGKYELAKTYWALGRWQDAAPLATDTVKALPDLAAAHVLLANILLKLRDGAGALREYQEYLRIEPQGAMAPQVRDMVDKLQKALPH